METSCWGGMADPESRDELRMLGSGVRERSRSREVGESERPGEERGETMDMSRVFLLKSKLAIELAHARGNSVRTRDRDR